MLLSKQEQEKASEPDPQVTEASKRTCRYRIEQGTDMLEQYVKKNPPPEMSGGIPAMRKETEAMEQALLEKLGPVSAGFEEFLHDMELRDGEKSTMKVVKPRDATPGPLVVLIFGGGFAAGSKDQLTEEARVIAYLFGATVVNISYRLTPEYKFPCGQLDAWDNLKWIAQNASGPILKADPSKGFLIGGVSAGGAITAVLSRKFQEEKLTHPLTGQWLAVPTLLDDPIVPDKYKEYFVSGEQNAKGTGLTKEDRMRMRLLGGWDVKSDLAWAGNSNTPLSRQPRTYFQVDGADVLRDDGLIYEEMLKDAGVPTKIDFYPGCPHAHWMMMPGIEVTDRARVDTIAGFAWLLGKSVSREEIAKMLKVPV